jgi:hypothetical protein
MAVDTDQYYGRVPKIKMIEERNVRKGFFDDDVVAAVKARLPTAGCSTQPRKSQHLPWGQIVGTSAGCKARCQQANRVNR